MQTDRNFVGEVLRDEHIDVYPEDDINPPMEAEIHDNETIIVRRATPVTIINFVGERHSHRTHAKTVQHLVETIGFIPKEGERVMPVPSTIITPDMEIRLITFATEEFEETLTIPFETEYISDSSIEMPTEIVEQEGKNGVQKKTYQFVYENDELTDTVLLSDDIVEDPITEIIRVGTKLPSSGTTLDSGIASYYGDGFNGRLTASGSVFDNSKLTAAHRTLPFGTKLRVTSTRTGKSIIVEVTDRGPYVDGRIIDLSKTAFEAIAPLSNGITNVTLEVAS